VNYPALEFKASIVELPVRVATGDLGRADAAGRRNRAIAADVGDPWMRWEATFCPGAVLSLLHGDLAEAERLAEEALQIGSDGGEPDAFMIYGATVSEVRLYQGRGDEMVELVEQGVEANPGLPAWGAALAQFYAWTGRSAEAIKIVEEGASDRFARIPFDNTLSSALCTYADAAALAGAEQPAAILYALLEPYADQIAWTGATTYGHVRTYLGLLAASLDRDEVADQHFEFACGFHEANDMPLWAARTHLGWAEALARRGVKEHAHEEAARALDLSREHGYGAIEERAAAVVETGARAPG
jgi:tetratricopeptide (TPR) repeat protein